MNAKTIYTMVCAALAGVGTAVAEAMGGWGFALQTLITVMAIDYATGCILALVWKKSSKSEDGAFESKASVKGLLRKMCYLACVFLAAKLDVVFGTGTVCRTAVILFFIANDGFSILENFGAMGVPYPAFLKNAFAMLREKSEGAASELTWEKDDTNAKG